MSESVPAAHVVIVGPGAPVRAVGLDAPRMTLGSDASCELRLLDPEAEPVHAELRRDGARFDVVRRGSVMSVNGKRVREKSLDADDLIILGRTAIAFRWGAPPRPAPSEAHAEGFALQACEQLFAIARRMQAKDASSAIRRQLVSSIVELTGAQAACCAWLDAAGAPTITETVSDPPDAADLVPSRMVIARVLDARRPLLWLDVPGLAPSDTSFSLKAAAVASILAVPVARGSSISAVLYAVSARPMAFTQETVDLVVVFASLVESLLVDVHERQVLEQSATQVRGQLEDLRRNTLVGASPAMQRLDKDVRKIARSDLAVLVLGETGTGKELVARQLHENSGRRDGPFVAVNSGAIPEELIEATLFGHIRGAFTGAHADQLGLIRAAHGGTLFLDEIAELALDKQAKVLRVLEAREVLPVGATSPVPVDFRLVSATLRPLEEARRGGLLREDLFYRIAGVTLRLPPLRERGDDVLLLAEHFLRQRRSSLSRPGLRLSAAARAALRAYPWPGNVRELATAMGRASALAEGDTIEVADLGLPEAVEVGLLVPLAEARDAFQKRYVLETVERMGGNRSAAAEALGVTPRTIYKYLDEV